MLWSKMGPIVRSPEDKPEQSKEVMEEGLVRQTVRKKSLEERP